MDPGSRDGDRARHVVDPAVPGRPEQGAARPSAALVAQGHVRGRCPGLRGGPARRAVLDHPRGTGRAGDRGTRAGRRGPGDPRARRGPRLVVAFPAVPLAFLRRGGRGDAGAGVRRGGGPGAVRARSRVRVRPGDAVHRGGRRAAADDPAATARPVPGAVVTMTPLRYRVRQRRVETADTVTLVLDPVDEPIVAPLPGQFTMMYAFGVGEVPISVSGHVDGAIVHTLRDVGAVTKALAAAATGDVLGIRGPFGTDWGVPAGGDLVVMAGGIGLAPLRPVIRQAVAGRSRTALLGYAVKGTALPNAAGLALLVAGAAVVAAAGLRTRD